MNNHVKVISTNPNHLVGIVLATTRHIYTGKFYSESYMPLKHAVICGCFCNVKLLLGLKYFLCPIIAHTDTCDQLVKEDPLFIRCT